MVEGDPYPRNDEHDGWWQVAHENNKKRVVDTDGYMAKYDMVFYGDDLVENLSGLEYGKRRDPDGDAIDEYFRETFTYEGERSNLNSVALGITGDSVRLDTFGCFTFYCVDRTCVIV